MNKKKELTRGVKFILFSISAGVIEFGSFALLDGLTQWAYWPKYLIALTLSVLWNFTLNRHFTFRSAGNVPIAMLKVALYYAVFTPVTTIMGNYLAETCGWNDLLVTILNMALNLVTEYLYDRCFVFGKTIDTNKKAVAAEHSNRENDFEQPQKSELKSERNNRMKITTFNPMIVTKNAEATIALFEALGFERRHTKENISATGASDVRMKDANGHHVDIVAGDGEYTMIRVNVDDFDEAIEFFMSHGFRKPHHEEAKKTTDTGSSRFTVVVSPSGYILAVSQHIKDND